TGSYGPIATLPSSSPASSTASPWPPAPRSALSARPAMRRGRISIFSCSRRPSTRKTRPGSRASPGAHSSGRTLPLHSNCQTQRRPPRGSSPSSSLKRGIQWSASLVVGLESKPISADSRTMALRIATRLPRLVIVGVVLLLASATLAVGAAKRLTAVPQGAPAPVSAPTLVVPDLSGQAFVFAKGTLEDTGFAWHVTGPPTIIVKLARTPYPEKGEPEDISPYVGTPVQPIRLASTIVTPATPVPAAPRGAEQKAPTAAKPPTTKAAPQSAAPTERPVAFVLAGAPKEPLKEMPL